MKQADSPALPLAALLLGFAVGAAPAGAAPKVVTSIKPVHSLVAGVMEGVAAPKLLLGGGSSPHSYSLRPSEARALSSADVVFWIGEGMETFLDKPLEALAGKARVVALAESPGIELLEAREGGAWEGHDEDHAAHDDEGHAGHHGARNMHIWLDPHNAERMVRAVVDALSRADPPNAARYRSNGTALVARVAALDGDIAATLAPVRDVAYVVFHDAYPYFERRYGTRAVGSISVSPDRAPGARRLSEIRRKIVESKAACVFSEPQFEPALVATVIEGTPAKTGVLDPLGATLDAGPEAYFELMRGLAAALKGCLSPAS